MISLTAKIANNSKYNTPNVVYRGTDKLTDTYLVQIQGIALTPLGARILLGTSTEHMGSYEVECNSYPSHVCRLSYKTWNVQSGFGQEQEMKSLGPADIS